MTDVRRSSSWLAVAVAVARRRLAPWSTRARHRSADGTSSPPRHRARPYFADRPAGAGTLGLHRRGVRHRSPNRRAGPVARPSPSGSACRASRATGLSAVDRSQQGGGPPLGRGTLDSGDVDVIDGLLRRTSGTRDRGHRHHRLRGDARGDGFGGTRSRVSRRSGGGEDSIVARFTWAYTLAVGRGSRATSHLLRLANRKITEDDPITTPDLMQTLGTCSRLVAPDTFGDRRPSATAPHRPRHPGQRLDAPTPPAPIGSAADVGSIDLHTDRSSAPSAPARIR